MKFLLTAFMFSQVFAGGDSVKPTRVEWYSDIAGTYSGTLCSAGRDIPVETTFYFEGAVLLGEYVMDEDSILTRGNISAVSFDEEYLLTCTWTDVYGSGSALFSFTDNCNGFAGYWRSESGASSFNWWGEKEETDIQQLIRD